MVGLAAAVAVAGAGLSTSSPVAILIAWGVAIALALLSPAGVLTAAIATLPWFFHPIAFGGQHVPASEMLLLAVIVAVALREATAFTRSPGKVARDRLRRTQSILMHPVTIAILVIVVVGAVLVAYPYDPSHRAESLREWRWTLAEPLLLVLLLDWLRRDNNMRLLAAIGLVAGATAASAQGLVDYATGGGVMVEGVRRIAGPYPHPNALALYLTRVLALGGAWWWLSRRSRAWLTPAVVVCAAAVVATLSRGAFIGIAAAVFVMLPTLPRRLRVAAIASGATAAIAVTIVARERMLDLFSGGSGSLRLDIWGSAARMIRDHPIAGYGPDQFLYAYLPRYVEPTAWNERFTAHAHDFLLDFWIRLGIIGFALAVAAVIVVAIGGVRLWTRRWRGDVLAAASLVGLVAMMTHGLVDNAYFGHDLAMSGWLLAWLAFGPGSCDTTEGVSNGARPHHGRRGIHWFAPVRQFARRRP
jgi:O-antigen ligase